MAENDKVVPQENKKMNYWKPFAMVEFFVIILLVLMHFKVLPEGYISNPNFGEQLKSDAFNPRSLNKMAGVDYKGENLVYVSNPNFGEQVKSTSPFPMSLNKMSGVPYYKSVEGFNANPYTSGSPDDHKEKEKPLLN